MDTKFTLVLVNYILPKAPLGAFLCLLAKSEFSMKTHPNAALLVFL